MTLKLEVGKTYIDGEGRKITLNGDSTVNLVYPFCSASGSGSFTEDGLAHASHKTVHDLVSEYVEPVATPQASARTPHKWAKEMHAFADGYEIECYFPDGKVWFVINEPSWTLRDVYRIKPEPTPLSPNDVKFIGISETVMTWIVNTAIYTGPKAIRIEYDPNTQTLVSAEVVTL